MQDQRRYIIIGCPRDAFIAHLTVATLMGAMTSFVFRSLGAQHPEPAAAAVAFTLMAIFYWLGRMSA